MTARYFAALLFVASAIACAPKPLELCRTAFEQEDYARAATLCDAEYQATGSIPAGAFAARAERKLEHFDQVIAWAERLGDAPDAAVAWRGAAAVYTTRGDAGRARAANLRAAELYEKSGDLGSASYHAHLVGAADRMSSRLLEALEQTERSYDLAWRSTDAEMKQVSFSTLFTILFEVGDHDGARALLRKTQARLTEPDPIFTLNFRFDEAMLHEAEKRAQLAAAEYESALKYYELLPAPEPQFLRAIRLNLMGLYIELQDLDRAEKQLQLAEAEAPAEKPNHIVSSAAYHRGQMLLARGRAAEAEKILATALGADPIADWRWRLEHLLGLALRDQKRSDEAQRAFERSIETVEAMRSSLKFDELKSTLLAEHREPYEALFLIHFHAGRIDAALEVSERARSRAFLDAFLGAADPAGASPIAKKRLAAIQDLAPALNASPVATPHPIAAVLKTLANRDAIAFFSAEKELYRYSRLDGKERLQKLDAGVVKLTENIRATATSTAQLAAFDQLGRMLFGELALGAPSAKPLHIVADEPLAQLPFAALRVDRHFLVEKRAIVRAPSLNVLAASLEWARTSSDAAVVIGAGRSFEPARRALPQAEVEAENTAERLGVKARVSASATREALYAAANASLLHVAAHAAISPRGTWIELADGPVDAPSILAKRVRPRFAILAACVSGPSATYDATGTLATAFLAAGTELAIATRTSVSDELARAFAADFYEANGARAPAQALAEVQRAWIARGRPISEWSLFVALGLAR